MFPNLGFSHISICSGMFWTQQQRFRPRLNPPSPFPKAECFILNHATSGADPSGESNGQEGELGVRGHHDLLMSFEFMSPDESAKPDQMSTSSLAYLGDVVFELFVRSRYVWPNRRMADIQNKVVSIVRAESQSKLLQKFIESFPLTSTEQGILARGRNASLTARKKGKSANSGGASTFQNSTAFEALLGYTYMSDKQRFNEIISWMKLELDELDTT